MREILLTNDDGIDSPGLTALYASLSALENTTVTVVAPATDQSAMGRATSDDVAVEEHELGYLLSGTPVDCVVAGLSTLAPDPDLVVAGVNQGANLGSYVLGRSGTVSAAVEAAFAGVPGIAASLYIPAQVRDIKALELTPGDFAHAVGVTTHFVQRAFDADLFAQTDYLNINAPMATDESPAPSLRLTRPSPRYDMTAEWAEGDSRRVHLNDRIWERMAAGDIESTPGTDRHAILNGDCSVSPLVAPHDVPDIEAIETLVDQYNESPPRETH